MDTDSAGNKRRRVGESSSSHEPENDAESSSPPEDNERPDVPLEDSQHDEEPSDAPGQPAFTMEEFRVLLADEDSVVGFITEVAKYDTTRCLDFARMVQSGVVDAHPADILSDIFCLHNPEPGSMSDGDLRLKLAECLDTVYHCLNVQEVYERLNKRLAAAVSRLLAVVGRMEEVQEFSMMGVLYGASARLYTMREGLCGIMETRVPPKVREMFMKMMVRLSSGCGEINDFQKLLVILTNKCVRGCG
eukprot:jgi/Mesvir1/18235/Mv09514-RA.1